MEIKEKVEDNLVKKTCQELGITQKELAKRTGFSERSITKWINGKSNIPINFQKSIELLKHSEELVVLKKSMKIINGN